LIAAISFVGRGTHGPISDIAAASRGLQTE